MNLRDVGKKIKQLRMQLGLTQSQLAEKIKVSYQQVQKYEKGESKITILRFLEIAKALETTPYGLLENIIAQKIAEPKKYYSSDKSQSLIVTPQEKKLITYFRNIKDIYIKQNILKLLKSISELNPQK